MKKLLTTLALALGLAFGSMTLSAPAQADDSFAGCGGFTEPACPTPAPTCGGFSQPACPPVPGCGAFAPPAWFLPGGQCGQPNQAGVQTADVTDLHVRLTTAEQTANEYRAQVVALTVKVERVQRVADQRAATIKRLRAKIRSLR
jgi:hypothetical protein